MKIPLEFLRSSAVITWRDLRYGICHHLVAPSAAIAMAQSVVRAELSPLPLIRELAQAQDSDPVLGAVSTLASQEAVVSEQATQDKWLYLALSWVFKNRDSFQDPLAIAQQVYEDFGYPAQVAPFVRYMPMQGADRGSKEANEMQLLKNWEVYLMQAGSRFQPGRGGKT
jgi:hypothetical protein